MLPSMFGWALGLPSPGSKKVCSQTLQRKTMNRTEDGILDCEIFEDNNSIARMLSRLEDSEDNTEVLDHMRELFRSHSETCKEDFFIRRRQCQVMQALKWMTLEQFLLVSSALSSIRVSHQIVALCALHHGPITDESKLTLIYFLSDFCLGKTAMNGGVVMLVTDIICGLLDMLPPTNELYYLELNKLILDKLVADNLSFPQKYFLLNLLAAGLEKNKFTIALEGCLIDPLHRYREDVCEESPKHERGICVKLLPLHRVVVQQRHFLGLLSAKTDVNGRLSRFRQCCDEFLGFKKWELSKGVGRSYYNTQCVEGFVKWLIQVNAPSKVKAPRGMKRKH